jgi:SAM-dependent methyltransferase
MGGDVDSDLTGYALARQHGETAIASKPQSRVLDAGCGRRCCLDYGPDAYVVGLDIGEVELAANEQLDERIVGALETYPLPRESFDVVVCQDVLEHVERPTAALRNMMRAVKPGGLLILGLPNVVNPKGLVTKFTPLRFHLWVYRRVWRNPVAGTPGHGPYKTYLRWSLRPSALRRLARRNGFEVEEFMLWGTNWPSRLRERDRTGYVAWRVLEGLWRILTLNRVDPEQSEIWTMLRKTEGPPTRFE